MCTSWILLLIKVLNNFWYFKHKILTRMCSEAYLKYYWRNCLLKLLNFFTLFKDKSSIVLQICFRANPSRGLVFEISKIVWNFDQKQISDMYWHGHKTATLYSFQHTALCPPPPSILIDTIIINFYSKLKENNENDTTFCYFSCLGRYYFRPWSETLLYIGAAFLY